MDRTKAVKVHASDNSEEIHTILRMGAAFAWKLLLGTPEPLRDHIEAKLAAGEIAYAPPREMTIKGVDREDLDLMPTYGFWRDEDGALIAGIAVGTQGHAYIYETPDAEEDTIRFIELGEVEVTEVTLRVVDGGKGR